MNLPEFEEAIRQFADFVAAQHLPTRICWVFRDDVAFASRRSWKSPARTLLVLGATDDVPAARRRYERARPAGLGVHLLVIGASSDTTFSTLYVPRDDEDAMHRMIDGLKLSVPVPVPTVQVATGEREFSAARRAMTDVQREHLNDLLLAV